MELIRSPDVKAAADLLREYISRPYLIQVSGPCSVNYQGRAQSKLDHGERLVIVKQDNAVLVHGPDGYQPKNWQPETDRFEVTVEDGQLHLESIRTDPRETVEIIFEDLDMLYVTQLVDRSELKIAGHEVDIHEAIEEDPDIIEDGLVVIEREKGTPAGYIDVFARDTEDRLVVIEVKRNPDYNSVIQLNRYLDEIADEFPDRELRGILVAPELSANVEEYLEERDLEFIDVDMDDVIPEYRLKQEQSRLDGF